MKKFQTLFKICFAVVVLSMVSCSADNSSAPVPSGPINTGELKLFVVDTAKINTISTSGSNEVTILNHMINGSSGIGNVSVSPNGEKIVYTVGQRIGTIPDVVKTLEIRMANSDGTEDSKIYEVTNDDYYISALKYCSDGKIFFAISADINGFNDKLYLMNANGTELQELSFSKKVVDVSDDRSNYIVQTGTGIEIYSSSSDNATPVLYHTEQIASLQNRRNPTFTNDGKYVVSPYLEGSKLNARVIDIVAKTSVTIPLLSGLTGNWHGYSLDMASDSKRGVLTHVASADDKSKTYIFDVNTGVVNAPFENNDDVIQRVYAW